MAGGPPATAGQRPALPRKKRCSESCPVWIKVREDEDVFATTRDECATRELRSRVSASRQSLAGQKRPGGKLGRLSATRATSGPAVSTASFHQFHSAMART